MHFLYPMSSLILFVLSLLILHTGAPAVSAYDPLNSVERQALLTFINKVTHSPSINWNESEPACTWKGVTCDPDGITVLYLRLPMRSLLGEIPFNTIGMLNSLRVLSIRNNGLSGVLPLDFNNLVYLTTLYLNGNKFSGVIPLSIFTLPYLNRLLLDDNNFSGSLPDRTISKDLTTFNVSINKLVGRIPSSFSKFRESAFSNNRYLCGPPLRVSCNASIPPPTSHTSDVEPDNTSTGRRAIFVIYSGSTMVLLILFGSLGKKMYQHIIPPSELMEKKKLVIFEDSDFKLEDLLKTNAELLGKGSLGTSYAQVHKEKDETVVLKILKDVVTEEEFKTKMNVLGTIRKKKYVVPLRAFYSFSSNKKLLVYDYMTADSLSDRLHVHTGKDKTLVLKILKDVVVIEEEFKTNINFLGRIRKNKYVVSLRAFYSFSNGEKLLVYDYMPAGSLSDRLHGSIRTQFYWDHRMLIAPSAARGLASLHKDEIVHGNITSSNIFQQQDTNNDVLLSDYGLNTLYHGSSSLNHRVIGYWAPEVPETLKFTIKSDVYSFGVLLLELLTGKSPMQASVDKERVHFSDWVSLIVCGEPKVELFDVKLMRNQNFDKIIELAKECVLIALDQLPPMCDVVRRMEDIC